MTPSTMDRLAVDIRLPLDRFQLDVAFQTDSVATGIFGPSGAGKSSLLEVIAGLRPGAEGQLQLGEQTWLDSARRRSVPTARRGIGYVPQDGLLFPHRSVRQNLLAGRRRLARAAADSSFDAVVAQLALAPLLDQNVQTLSGGERQRVALGRALCASPRLLLLDEPLAALDLPLRRRLLPLLQQVRASLTVPMLLVSHDPVEILALCTQVVVLDRGQVMAIGAPHEVLADPTIFPLADRRGFENVVAGHYVDAPSPATAGTVAIRLGDGDDGPRLLVSGDPGSTGMPVLVGLPSAQIMIATERPRGLSARNVVPASVASIRTAPTATVVTATIAEGVPPLAVDVTAATPDALGLVPGRPIFLVVKATACRIYGPTSRDDSCS